MRKLSVASVVLFLICSIGFAGPVYYHDDGSAEDALGLTAGGSLMWMNAFQVIPGGETIRSIGFAPYGTYHVSNGTPMMAYIWSDPTNDGNPADAVPKASFAFSYAHAGADVYTWYGIGPVTFSAGDYFFAGLAVAHNPGEYPAAFDENSSAGRSWISIGGDPSDLSGAMLLDNIGFPGNFMIRASSEPAGSAVPEPATFTLIGVGLLGLASARRLRSRRG